MLTLALAVSAGFAFAADVPVERQTLMEKDGWAASEGVVTGGAAAKDEHVFTVSSRAELVKALKTAGDNPKIIKIKGTINLSTDDSGKELTLKDYAVGPFEGADPYDFEQYKKITPPPPGIWSCSKASRPS